MTEEHDLPWLRFLQAAHVPYEAIFFGIDELLIS